LDKLLYIINLQKYLIKKKLFIITKFWIFSSILYYINRINKKSKNTKKKSKTISGISKWFEWTWLITGQFAGYIRAHSLPHIGVWTNFSPAQISNLCSTICRPSQ
jgi:hypothetical protein